LTSITYTTALKKLADIRFGATRVPGKVNVYMIVALF